MRVFFILLSALMAGCSYFDQCPVKVGDRVERLDNGMKGVVVAKDQRGSYTENCRCVVLYDTQGSRKFSSLEHAWVFRVNPAE